MTDRLKLQHNTLINKFLNIKNKVQVNIIIL